MKFKLLKIKRKLLKNNKEKSRGRSMVEMLGVLAIIGVLSIGGISGYTIAMRRYKANEILQVANKYALTVYSEVDSRIRNDSINYSFHGEIFEANNNFISFTNSGLGGIPSGIESISFYMVKATENSGDIVMIVLKFTDTQLCRTIETIADTYQDGPINGCERSTPSLFLNFYMN